jgi:hypothetical protein
MFTNAVVAADWESAPEPLTALQEAMKQALSAYCPLARPSAQARSLWSPRCAELLAATRRSRTQYSQTHSPWDRASHRSLQNQLKREMRRVGQAAWRTFIQDSTRDGPQNPHNKGLWRLSKWSRKAAGKPKDDPHIPALRRTARDPLTQDNRQKVEILAEKFFPQVGSADLSDINEEAPLAAQLDISNWVSEEELKEVIRKLPNGKAAGIDRVANEAWKLVVPHITAGMSRAISKHFAEGSMPPSLKESITITLRKD